MTDLFAVHLLNDDGIEKAKKIADVFRNLLSELNGLCPEGREFSIVKTNLETASFFAKKSMAMDQANQREVK